MGNTQNYCPNSSLNVLLLSQIHPLPLIHLFVLLIHPDDDNFKQILADFGPFDLIGCFSFLEHLPYPHSNLSKIEHLLAPGGYTLLEVPNSDYIREKGLLSEIIPDHLHYFTARSLVTLAFKAQLNLQSLNSTWSDYILSCLFKKSEVCDSVVSRLSTRHHTLLDQINSKVSSLNPGEKIAIWGAGHQSLFILASYFMIVVVIDSSAKQDKFIPGSTSCQHPSMRLSEPISLFLLFARL